MGLKWQNARLLSRDKRPRTASTNKAKVRPEAVIDLFSLPNRSVQCSSRKEARHRGQWSAGCVQKRQKRLTFDKDASEQIPRSQQCSDRTIEVEPASLYPGLSANISMLAVAKPQLTCSGAWHNLHGRASVALDTPAFLHLVQGMLGKITVSVVHEL